MTPLSIRLRKRALSQHDRRREAGRPRTCGARPNARARSPAEVAAGPEGSRGRRDTRSKTSSSSRTLMEAGSTVPSPTGPTRHSRRLVGRTRTDRHACRRSTRDRRLPSLAVPRRLGAARRGARRRTAARRPPGCRSASHARQAAGRGRARSVGVEAPSLRAGDQDEPEPDDERQERGVVRHGPIVPPLSSGGNGRLGRGAGDTRPVGGDSAGGRAFGPPGQALCAGSGAVGAVGQ